MFHTLPWQSCSAEENNSTFQIFATVVGLLQLCLSLLKFKNFSTVTFDTCLSLLIVDACSTGALHAGKALTKLISASQRNSRSATKQDTEPPQIMLKTPPTTKLQRIFLVYQSEQFKGGSVATHEQYTKVVAKVKTKEYNRYASACASSTSGVQVQQFVQA